MDKVKLIRAVDSLSDLTMNEWTTLKYIIDSCFEEKQREYSCIAVLPAANAKNIIESQPF